MEISELTTEDWDDIIEHSFGDHGIPYIFKYRHMGWRHGEPPERYPNEGVVTTINPELIEAWFNRKSK